MKNYLIILAFVFWFAACNKDDSPKPKSDITGTWELRMYTANRLISQNYDAGNGNRYVFNADGSYVKYSEDGAETEGKYTLTPTGEDNGTYFGKITLSNPDYEDVYSIRQDTFTIGSSIADGASWQYVRLK